jgi:hypothetical protein
VSQIIREEAWQRLAETGLVLYIEGWEVWSR